MSADGASRPRRASRLRVCLPADLLAEVDRYRKSKGESRREVVRRALEQLIDARLEADSVREYVEAYRRMPESPEEVTLATPSAEELAALARENPWE